MFGFAQWDSPFALVFEVVLSLLIVGGIMLLVRRVNASAEADRRKREADLESGTKTQNDQHS